MAVRFDLESINRETVYRTLVIVAGVVLILWGCLVVLRPFIPAFLLAIIFTLSTWPAFIWLKARLNGRRTLAAFIMTLALALCFLVPIVFLGSSVAENFGRLYTLVLAPVLNSPGDMPQWARDLPMIGPHLETVWTQYIAQPLQDGATLKDHVAPKLIAVGRAIGQGVLDLSLGVLIAFFFFRHGVTVAQRVNTLLAKFAGARAQHMLTICKKTVIGVVYGILGTAVAQGALAGIGLWLADVPGAAFLGLITIVLSFVPMGPPLIWVPATFWLYTHGQTGVAIFMAVWGVLVISGVDNVVRPYFISLGSNLPLPLVLLGVFGGLIAFGFIGLFIGPTLLALAWTLIVEWSHSDRRVAEDAEAA
ncbi:MAG: AI-2E family transporter [Rhodospirillales bacterium]|nr:AI-2E family transporter [Alphaproteobacteria bacterium]MCB9986416.1 AI-2E family transporter [Rhodospirillales bacterium]USO07038.1 MAG: AI-2E family transporter [Rhodospirillales bacterium]